MKKRPKVSRLCFTRAEVVAMTGLAYKSICALEKRGILMRINTGLQVACYSASSVKKLFGEEEGQAEAPFQPTHPQNVQTSPVKPLNSHL
jgi:hypothetical protein